MRTIVGHPDDGNPPHAVIDEGGNAEMYSPGTWRESWDDVGDHEPVVAVLTNTPFMDSADVAKLIGAARTSRDNDRLMVAVCEKPSLARLLATTGLHRLFQITPSYATALEILRDAGR